MIDVYIYTGITVCITILVLFASIYLSKISRSQKRIAVGLFAILIFLIIALFVPWWVIFLSHAKISIFLYGNLQLWTAVLFFLSASNTLHERRKKRAVYIITGFVFIISLLQTLLFIFPHNINTQSIPIKDGMIFQTTYYTCAPVAEVALLYKYNIQTNEKEMAKLSYTQAGRGTNKIGMYYALREKVLGTKYENKARIEILTLEDLKSLNKPVVVSTNLAFLITHALLIESFEDGSFSVIDPLKGRYFLTSDKLAQIWTDKVGIYIDAVPEI